MNRAEIVAELARIRALLEGIPSDDDLAGARLGIEALGEAIGRGDLFDADGCPFEPGPAKLVGFQSRNEKKTKRRKKKKEKKKAGTAPKVAVRRTTAADGEPLIGRIAAMVRDGVPTEEIVALYRIKPEHVPAFIAAYVTPARQPDADGDPEGAGGRADLTRCPTPS